MKKKKCITTLQKKELQKLFDMGDLLFLERLISLCYEEDKNEINSLLYLNNIVGIGWGNGDYSLSDETDYHNRMFKICDKYEIKQQ